MQAFAEQSTARRVVSSSRPAQPGQAHSRASFDSQPHQHALGTLGNHAVRGLLDGNDWSSERRTTQTPLYDGPVPSSTASQTATATQTAPAVQTTPAAKPTTPPVVAAPPKAGMTNAPTSTSLIPFDTAPMAAPGERVIFNGEFSDPSPANYRLEYSTTGGHFSSATGGTSQTIAGLTSGNVDFFVPAAWDGRTALSVTLKVVKISDSSVAFTQTWTFTLKKDYPTSMTQKEGTGEVNLPGTYSYDIGPALRTGHKPFYEHMTVLEKFDQGTVNIAPADIKPKYRTDNALNSTADIVAHFNLGGSGGNGTFTIDANDQIFDQHGGHYELAELVSNLVAPKQIEVALPQTYEAKPGTALGRYMITRVLHADGTTWKVKKGTR
ncbi:MAG: hypothetical protein ABSB60_08370 [Terracidiphilus sp.]|jgi:hypothetical protein